MSKEIKFLEGSENVFADIGVRDSEDSLIRAKLAKQIADVIGRRRLTQTEVARILQIDQPKVSKLVRGRILGFTSDRLLKYLTALGCDASIRVSRPRRSRIRGRVMVAAG